LNQFITKEEKCQFLNQSQKKKPREKLKKYMTKLKVKDIISEPIKLHNPSVSSKDLNNYIYDLLESVELTQQSVYY
jgi:ABC-type oligopeptide transport system ATPase subunit